MLELFPDNFEFLFLTSTILACSLSCIVCHFLLFVFIFSNSFWEKFHLWAGSIWSNPESTLFVCTIKNFTVEKKLLLNQNTFCAHLLHYTIHPCKKLHSTLKLWSWFAYLLFFLEKRNRTVFNFQDLPSSGTFTH